MQRETYTIDAAGKVLGRMSTDIAMHLMGKHRPDFVPHIDSGDIVVVTNIAQVVLTGKKLEQKMHYTHSNHPGGLKVIPLKRTMAENPGEALRKAVDRMLPKNKHRTTRLNRLKVS